MLGKTAVRTRKAPGLASEEPVGRAGVPLLYLRDTRQIIYGKKKKEEVGEKKGKSTQAANTSWPETGHGSSPLNEHRHRSLGSS